MVRAIQKTLKKVHNRRIESIGGAALIIALSGVLSRLLGFLRDRMLAGTFGAGDALDAYYAAFRIPDLFYGLLIAGALTAAFIPLFTELQEKENTLDGWRLTNGLLQAVAVVLGFLSLLGMIFTPLLIAFLVPGFGDSQQELTVTLTRIMLLSPLFLGLSAVFGGVLVSLKRFVAYSLAPVIYNLGIIFGILFLVPTYGILGVAWGVVIGAIFHMLIQYPAFLSTGFVSTKEPLFFWKDKNLRSVIALMIPRSLSMGISQFSLFFVTIFASTLSVGTLTAYNFANNIQSVPLGIFGVAFSLAAFPVLSMYAAKKKHEEFFYSVINTSKRILFFVIPVSVIMILFRAQFVRIILGSGAFDWEDTIMTFGILHYFALSLFAQCLIPLFARSFFALKNTKTPLYIAFFSEAIHILSLILLLPYFREQALAISFSLGTTTNFLLLYFALRKQAPFWQDKEFLLPVSKMVLAAIIAGVVAQVSKSIFALTTDELDTFIEVFLQLTAGVLIGGGVYFAAAIILKIEEIGLLHKLLFQKMLRRPVILAQTKDQPERGDW